MGNRKPYYSQFRRLYFDKVVSMFESGVSISDIVLAVPISASTVYRWRDEHLAKIDSPRQRNKHRRQTEEVRRLKNQVSRIKAAKLGGDKSDSDDNTTIELLMCGIDDIATELKKISGNLSALTNKLPYYQ